MRRIVRFVCISCCEAVRIFRVVSLFDYQGSSLSAVIAATFIEYHVFNLLSTLFSIFFNFVFPTGFSVGITFYHTILIYASINLHIFQILKKIERRKRDLTPRAAINDLHP